MFFNDKNCNLKSKHKQVQIKQIAYERWKHSTNEQVNTGTSIRPAGSQYP